MTGPTGSISPPATRCARPSPRRRYPSSSRPGLAGLVKRNDLLGDTAAGLHGVLVICPTARSMVASVRGGGTQRSAKRLDGQITFVETVAHPPAAEPSRGWKAGPDAATAAASLRCSVMSARAPMTADRPPPCLVAQRCSRGGRRRWTQPPSARQSDMSLGHHGECQPSASARPEQSSSRSPSAVVRIGRRSRPPFSNDRTRAFRPDHRRPRNPLRPIPIVSRSARQSHKASFVACPMARRRRLPSLARKLGFRPRVFRRFANRAGDMTDGVATPVAKRRLPGAKAPFIFAARPRRCTNKPSGRRRTRCKEGAVLCLPSSRRARWSVSFRIWLAISLGRTPAVKTLPARPGFQNVHAAAEGSRMGDDGHAHRFRIICVRTPNRAAADGDAQRTARSHHAERNNSTAKEP